MPPTSYYAESQAWHIWRECGECWAKGGYTNETSSMYSSPWLGGGGETRLAVNPQKAASSHSNQAPTPHHTAQRSSSPCSVRPCSWWLSFLGTGAG